MSMDVQFKSTVFPDDCKRIRARKRGTLKAIQNQVEFYFGDANLQHDQYLVKEMKKNKDGFVLIDVVASRKQMKQITNDLSMIIKAIRNSSLLQMNKDLTMVRRIAPLQNRNADARTVYVERLPIYADLEWLRSIFMCCGNIEYISLPRYKNSGEVQGFAFIEYKSEEDAEKACQVLNSIYTRTNSVCESDSLHYPMSASFTYQKGMKRHRFSSATFSDKDEMEEFCKEIQLARKRPKVLGGNSLFPDPSAQICIQSKDVNFTEKLNYIDCSENSSEKSTTVRDMEAGVQTVDKRRRKRKKKMRKENQVEIPPLYVIHKKEWLRLKKLYKSIQKDYVSILKAELTGCKRSQGISQGMEKHGNMDSVVKKDIAFESAKSGQAIRTEKNQSAENGNMLPKASLEKARYSKNLRGREKIEKLIQQLAESKGS